jgi:2-oxoisovalerate dehydrogenase E2 component (dihydrolipoyl transacylase)
MATVRMPQLGETVTEGTVGRWLKKEGDLVTKYEPLLEVETDKVASEIPSPFAGRLTKILATEGTTVPVGAPLCEISEEQARTTQGVPGDTGGMSGPPSAASGGPHGRQPTAEVPETSARSAARDGDGVRYSPAVRRLARQHGVDLRGLAGTGKGGRVTAKDVEQHLASGQASSSPAGAGIAAPAPAHMPSAPAAPLPAAADGDTLVRVTQMRKTIAQHMVLAKTTIPHAWSMVEADVTDLVRWREREKDAFFAREGVKLTVLPVVVQCVCQALREFPMVNATWGGDHIILRRHINIGIAVDIEEGLVVPVIRDADRMSVAGLARSIADLAAKARARKLTMEDMADGTFTVDNTGALGSVASYPIINSPQAAILTTEAILKRPWVIGEAIAIRSIMNLCLSLDHRVLDGSTASRFLQSVKRRLESFVPPS